jgi:hypothetical protein
VAPVPGRQRGRRSVAHGASACLSLAALAACTSAGGNPVTLVPSVTLSHFIALDTDKDGKAVSVADRSVLPELMTVLEYDDGSQRTATSAWVVGILPGGTSIPNLADLEPGPGGGTDPLRTVISNDGFLDQVGSGPGFALGRYSVRNRAGDKLFMGYRVAGDLITTMPVDGSASYEGVAHALMFGSQTGARDVSGKASLAASFSPGQAAISGRLTQLEAGGAPVGYEIALKPASISHSSFLEGQLTIENVGGGASGAAVYSGHWQGAFHGIDAVAAAGTFTIGATGVPLAGGGSELVQGVGGFGASRVP